MTGDEPAAQPPGPGVDRRGRAVIDPTKNVDTLVGDAVRRLDDLRAASERRQDDLRRAEERLHERDTENLKEMAALRSQHGKEMQVKESERIDAIRAVDAAAARESALAAEARATTLAGQVQAAADAMRTQVDAARVAASESQAVALAPIQEGLAAVQRFQYEAVGGKTQVVEARDAAADNQPVLDAIALLTAAMNQSVGGKTQVTESQAKSGNTGLWVGIAATVAFGLMSLMVAAAALVFAMTR